MPTERGRDGAAVITFRDAAEFEAWLAENVDLQVGVWLKIAKRGSDVRSLTDDEAVDLGLCYGWISGQRKSYDDVYYLQKYVPRRPRSRWSRVNVAKVEELSAAGRMRPSGLAEVEAAKADGRWAAAYAPPSEADVPADLLAAIAADPAAQAMFDVLTKTNRFALILRVNAVKRAQTRERKIGEFVAMLARHETIYPQKAKPSNSP
jgi:uncharacterized protein YdeI (YjbR/CyaY-like superfamily)